MKVNAQHPAVKILDRRKYAPTNFLATLLSTPTGSFQNRRRELTELARANIISRILPSGSGDRRRAYPDYFFYIYTKRPNEVGNFAHDLNVDIIGLTFEIWAARHNIPFSHKDEILNGKPFELPTSITHTFERFIDNRTQNFTEHFTQQLHPDDLFSLGGVNIALEHDQGTEQLSAKTFKDKRTWLRTFLQWRDVFKNELYKEHWGLDRLVLLITTTSEERAKSLMRFLKDELKAMPRSHCFAVVKELASTDKAPTPDLPLFGDWERVGHPPYNLGKEVLNVLEKKA